MQDNTRPRLPFTLIHIVKVGTTSVEAFHNLCWPCGGSTTRWLMRGNLEPESLVWKIFLHLHEMTAVRTPLISNPSSWNWESRGEVSRSEPVNSHPGILFEINYSPGPFSSQNGGAQQKGGEVHSGSLYYANSSSSKRDDRQSWWHLQGKNANRVIGVGVVFTAEASTFVFSAAEVLFFIHGSR